MWVAIRVRVDRGVDGSFRAATKAAAVIAADDLKAPAGCARPDASPKIQETAAGVVHARSLPYRTAVDRIATIAYILLHRSRRLECATG